MKLLTVSLGTLDFIVFLCRPKSRTDDSDRLCKIGYIMQRGSCGDGFVFVGTEFDKIGIRIKGT